MTIGYNYNYTNRKPVDAVSAVRSPNEGRPSARDLGLPETVVLTYKSPLAAVPRDILDSGADRGPLS